MKGIESEVIDDILDEVIENISPSEVKDASQTNSPVANNHDESIISIDDSINTDIFGDPVADAVQSPHLN